MYAMTEALKAKDTQACESGEQFVDLYYEGFDKRRHAISKLYLDTASLIWNGNKYTGQTEIAAFFDKLPVSKHTVDNITAQALTSEIASGQTAIIVATAGTVKYTGSATKHFTQTFTLTAQDNKWKVVADSVRLTE